MAVRENRGFHPILADRLPYLFVDACIQAWPDADYPNAHRHHTTAFGITAFRPYNNFEEAVEGMMEWHLVVRNNPNLLVATEAEHIRRAHREQRAAFILATQGGLWIGEQLYRVEMFHRLGLRMLMPSYNSDNTLGGGSVDSSNRGLTRFGELVVQECNRLGIVLDGSHCSQRTGLELSERSEHPMIYSHSGCRALVEHPRNVDDEQIRACAAKDGAVCIVDFAAFLFKPGMRRRPTVADMAEHIDHVAQVVGNTRNIAIGTDMSLGTYASTHGKDPWGSTANEDEAHEYYRFQPVKAVSREKQVDGFDSFSEVGNLVAELERRGYGETDIAAILGENLLRIFERVWGK
ncbi:MAG: membrane dipeptidase [Candidatus Lambdaproteobacteria bacterium]|nr:membrane dipeptidase [Candidatus Lambdaproteobacteria bacterium]